MLSKALIFFSPSLFGACMVGWLMEKSESTIHLHEQDEQEPLGTAAFLEFLPLLFISVAIVCYSMSMSSCIEHPDHQGGCIFFCWQNAASDDSRLSSHTVASERQFFIAFHTNCIASFSHYNLYIQ
jgi:hypothetical protein